MTRQELFEQVSNHDWFAVILIVAPYWFHQPDGSEMVGCQSLISIDVESDRGLNVTTRTQPDGPMDAETVIRHLRATFDQFGKPRIGVFIGESVWWSTAQMATKPETQPRAKDAQDLGVAWGQMPEAERSKLSTWLATVQLETAWTQAEWDARLN